MIDQIIIKYPIEVKSTRHGILMKLVGELFHKFGRELSEQIIRQHYELNEKKVSTPLKEHLREFAGAWDSFLSNAIKSLSASERRIFDQLDTGPNGKRSS